MMLIPLLVFGQIIQQNADTTLVDAYNGFGLRLVSRAGTDNVLISPISVASVLGLAWNGAVGETRQAIGRTLGFENLDADPFNAGNRQMLSLLRSSSTVANAVWVQGQASPTGPFVATAYRDFGATVSAWDLSNKGATDGVNGWVAKATNGKIDHIIDGPIANAGFVITNAVYIRARWAQSFDSRRTMPMTFTTSSGEAVSTPFMRIHGTFSYYSGPGLKAVSLPYRDGKTEMVFAMANGSVSGKQWQSAMAQMHTGEAEIAVPRFKASSTMDMASSLSALGMGIAFEPSRADFRGICVAGGQFIARVSHRAVIDVNEEGTEAAAATAVQSGGLGSPPPPKFFTFIADHPFLYAVRDVRSGAILFLGVLNSMSK